MKIQVTIDIDEEYADPDHRMGVTNEGYEEIVKRLGPLGDDIEVEAL